MTRIRLCSTKQSFTRAIKLQSTTHVFVFVTSSACAATDYRSVDRINWDRHTWWGILSQTTRKLLEKTISWFSSMKMTTTLLETDWTIKQNIMCSFPKLQHLVSDMVWAAQRDSTQFLLRPCFRKWTQASIEGCTDVGVVVHSRYGRQVLNFLKFSSLKFLKGCLSSIFI